MRGLGIPGPGARPQRCVIFTDKICPLDRKGSGPSPIRPTCDRDEGAPTCLRRAKPFVPFRRLPGSKGAARRSVFEQEDEQSYQTFAALIYRSCWRMLKEPEAAHDAVRQGRA